MKLRKSLALLLTLALTLGIAPIAGATGAVEGQSTTYNSVGTVTQSLSDSSESTDAVPDLIVDSTNEPGSLTVDTIHVTITNIYTIQVNPYGMTIEKPDNSDTSNESIVTSPMTIENRSGVKIEVTATATATPIGDVALVSESTREDPDPYEDPNKYSSDKRIYLYMQLSGFEEDGTTPSSPSSVITKEGGSGPLKVYIAKNTDDDHPTSATLQIMGNTSIPPIDRYTWHRGNGVSVTVVLSFMPIQDEPGYTVSFDAKDTFWDEGDGLIFDVQFLIDGKSEPLTLRAPYHSNGSPAEGMTVSSEKSLTFTVKTADELKGHCYMISDVILFSKKHPNGESLWHWQFGKDKRVISTHTINATEVQSNENLRVEVLLTDVNIK